MVARFRKYRTMAWGYVLGMERIGAFHHTNGLETGDTGALPQQGRRET